MGRHKKKSKNDNTIGCLIVICVIGVIGFVISNAQLIVNLLLGVAILSLIPLVGFTVYKLLKYTNERQIVIENSQKAEEKRLIAVEIREEEEKRFQERKQQLHHSPDFNYIQQFAKKYKSNPDSNDLSKLETLLQKNQWAFSTIELQSLVIEEEKRQHSENIKSRILSANPINLEDYIRNFIEICGNKTGNLKILDELLRSKNIFDSSDIRQLEQELKKVNEQIELEVFERRLLDGDSEITLDEIDALDGYKFEEFLKNLFDKMGFQVEQTRLSGDQGADLVVKKFGETTVIQAKRYGGKVGNYAVQEIVAAMSLYKAHYGMVVTNSYFTPSAVELAEANNIELINRNGLQKMIENHW